MLMYTSNARWIAMEHLHGFLLGFFWLQKHAKTGFPVSLLAMLD